MRIGACLFLLGTACLFQADHLPHPGWALLLTTASLLLCRYLLFRFFAFFLGGFTWALLYSLIVLSSSLEPGLEAKDLVISGKVINLPTLTSRYTRFDLDVQGLSDMQGVVYRSPGRIRLYWYAPYPEILPGNHLQLQVRLKQPRGLSNPDGFDYEAWLFQNGIRATGYVRQPLATGHGMSPSTSAGLLRYRLRQRLSDIVDEGSPAHGLIMALLIGDRGGIDPDQQRVMTQTGTGHLLAISGLHIGLIAGFAFVSGRRVWSLWLQGTQAVPAHYIAASVSILAALYYAALAGFSVPTQRALLMTVVVLACMLLSRRPSTSYVFALVLMIVLLVNPVSVITAGFWLSFVAVAVIMLALVTTNNTSGYQPWRQWLRIQFAVYLGLIPVQAYWFNEVSLWAIPANLVAIPWVGFVTLPLLMVGVILLPLSTALAAAVLHAGAASLGLLWNYLELLANVSVASIPVPTPTTLALAAAITAILILLIPAVFRGRYLALCWILPLLLPMKRLPSPGDYDVTVLDTGQGLSVVARTQNHTLLFDTGPGFADGFNAGRSIILPYLRARGYRRIDTLVQSHGDNDHIGGFDAIMTGIEVEEVLTSVPAQIRFAGHNCESGKSWTWDGIPFRMMHPPANHEFEGNNASCVLMLGPPGYKVLITGDIEEEAERWLMTEFAHELRARLLVVPHHGSKTSSSYGFIRAVDPDTAIIAAGYLNRFRLPNQDIIQRYLSRGVHVYNTATDGAISIKFTRGKLFISAEREQAPRFWNN